MAFREHPGFHIEVDPVPRRPKGALPRKRLSADRPPTYARGDEASTERAMWLNPQFRDETRQEIFSHLGKGGSL
jgi:hypothetical protein